MKIHFKLHRLKSQTPTDVTHSFIELFENHLIFNVRFYADEPIIDGDESSGVVNVFNCYEVHATKTKIAGLEKAWLSEVKLYVVHISVDGFTDTLRIHHKRESEADALVGVLNKWLYNPIFKENKEEMVEESDCRDT